MENEALYDDYLSGNLTGSALADFEQRLESDTEFRQSFDLHKETVRLIEIAALRNQLNRIADNTSNNSVNVQKKTRTIQISRTWFAAAAAMIGVVIIFAYQYVNRPSGTDALYAKYYLPDAGLPSMMGSSSNYTLDDAMVDYKSEEFDEAINKFKALHKGAPSNDTVTYYLGMAYMGKEDYDAALPLIEALSARENQFQMKAQWYRSLILLRQEKYNEAKKALTLIAKDPKNPFNEEAADLLAEWRKSSTFP